MTQINFLSLKNIPRLLLEAELVPMQGHRFNPLVFQILAQPVTR